MARQVESPPEQQLKPVSRPLATDQRSSSTRIISLLIVLGLLLVVFTGLLVRNLTQVVRPAAQGQATPKQVAKVQDDDAPILSLPGDATLAPPAVPEGHYVLYEQDNHVYVASTDGSAPVQVVTPGFKYMPDKSVTPNRSLLPILTPSGQLLYSGDGLWLADIFGGSATQIATLDEGQVITSLALSNDGSTIAWSTEPIAGSGSVKIFAGPLAQASLVYEHSADDCPCFRVYAFSNTTSKLANTSLLLTDDRGDHHAVQYGLWSFDFSVTPASDPLPLLDESPGQGPLAIAPYSNTLLYTSYEGFVPAPTDASVPDEAQDQNYANSLYLTTINAQQSSLGTSHMLLAEQHDLSNNAAYRWASTPLFSPDGHTLIYLEFSNDAQEPYDRHNAIYTVQVSGTGAQLQATKPRLLATSSVPFIELGSWLNAHTLTFYANGALYLLDSNTGATVQLVKTNAYDRVIAVIGQGLV